MLEITWIIEMSYVMKILSLPQLYQIGVFLQELFLNFRKLCRIRKVTGVFRLHTKYTNNYVKII